MSAFQKIITLKEELNKTIRVEGGKILKEELSKTLNLMPEVDYIMWAQNSSVYNDETYEFYVWGLDIMPKKDCPWFNEFIEELHAYWDDDEEDKYASRAHLNGESSYILENIADKLPEHRQRLKFISQTLRELYNSIPKEVFETFGDISAKLTRDSFVIVEYDRDY